MRRKIILFLTAIKVSNYLIIADFTNEHFLTLTSIYFQKMNIFKFFFSNIHFTFAHFNFVTLFSTLLLLQISSSVYSQSSTEPSRADCAARETQIVGACNGSKPTTELIVDHSRTNCCQGKAYYKCLKKLVATGVQCEMFTRDRIDEYNEILDKYDCDDVKNC